MIVYFFTNHVSKVHMASPAAYPALVNNGVTDVPVWVIKETDGTMTFIRRSNRPGQVPVGTLDSFKLGDVTVLVYPVVRLPKGTKPIILGERTAFTPDVDIDGNVVIDSEIDPELQKGRAPSSWYRPVPVNA